MGVEIGLKTSVGDALPAVAATGTITCTDASLGGTDTVGVSVPSTVEGAPAVVTTFTEGTDFTGGSGDDQLATDVAALLDAVAGISAAAVGNVITITAPAGQAGNSILRQTSNVAAFAIGGASPQALAGGRDENEAIEWEETIDEDGVYHLFLGGTEVARVAYETLAFDNKSTFAFNRKQLLKKSQC